MMSTNSNQRVERKNMCVSKRFKIFPVRFQAFPVRFKIFPVRFKYFRFVSGSCTRIQVSTPPLHAGAKRAVEGGIRRFPRRAEALVSSSLLRTAGWRLDAPDGIPATFQYGHFQSRLVITVLTSGCSSSSQGFGIRKLDDLFAHGARRGRNFGQTHDPRNPELSRDSILATGVISSRQSDICD